MSRIRRRLGAFLCLFVLGFSGCLLSPSASAPPGTTTTGERCSVDQDCLDGQVCRDTICRAKDVGSAHRVSLQFIPPPNYGGQKGVGNIIKQQFLGVSLKEVQDREFRPRPTYQIRGMVRINVKDGSGSTKKKPIRAKIRFISRLSIAGQPLISFVETRKSEVGRYQTRLSYGSYDIEVLPQEPDIPPYFQKAVHFEKKVEGEKPTTNELNYDLVLPDPAKCTRLEGKLVEAKSSRSALQNIQIQVLTRGKIPISNLATTGKDGRFRLWLTPEQEPALVRLKMSLGDKGVHPRVDLPYALLTKEREEKNGVIQLGNLPIGFQEKPVRVQGRVLSSLQEGGTAVPQSRLQFIGEIDFGSYKDVPLKGSFHQEVPNDENGYYDQWLPPGRYQVVVLPPNNTPWARALLKDQTIFGDKEINVSLVRKYTITGNICESGQKGNCQKLQKAQVHAFWRGAMESASLLDRPFQPHASTTHMMQNVESNGSYKLPLDPGIYDLVFVPQAGTGLARSFARVCLTKEKVTFNAFLPNAKYLVGLMKDDDGFRIGQMIVEMYEFSKRPTAPARLLGRTVTNANGRFSLPYRIPDGGPNDKCTSN